MSAENPYYILRPLPPGEQEIIRQIKLTKFNSCLTFELSRFQCPKCKQEEIEFSIHHGYYLNWNWLITW